MSNTYLWVGPFKTYLFVAQYYEKSLHLSKTQHTEKETDYNSYMEKKKGLEELVKW